MDIFSLLKYDPLAHTHEPLFDQNVHGDDLLGRQSRGIWKLIALLCLSVCFFVLGKCVCNAYRNLQWPTSRSASEFASLSSQREYYNLIKNRETHSKPIIHQAKQPGAVAT